MIYFNKKIILIFTLSVMALSCSNTKKENDTIKCQDSKEGKLIDLTGLDGCRWIIELKDGEKLIPLNLEDFDIKMIANKKVSLNYIEKNDMAGLCMAGEIVEIKCIVEISE